MVTEPPSGATDPRRSDTARYLASFREHRALVAGVLAVALLAALVTALGSPDRYQAETDVLVTPVAAENTALAGLGLLSDPAGAVFTAARLTSTPQVTTGVTRRLKLKLPRRDLLAKIKVTPLPQSSSFSIQATEDSADGAARLANAFADAVIAIRTAGFQDRLRAAIRRLERQRDTVRGRDAGVVQRDINEQLAYMQGFVGGRDPTLEVLSRAVAPDIPVAKSKALVLVAFVAALLLGTGLAVLLALLSPRIRGEYDLPPDLPLLARIPFLNGRLARRFFSGHGAAPPGAIEPYRILRARLAAAGVDAELPESLLVTSAQAEEGKTRTAVGLAAAIASSGRRVVLVDADFRASEVSNLFGLEPREEGFVSLLEGRSTALEEVLVPAGERWPELRVLPAGRDPARGIDLLEPARIEAALRDVAHEADVLVIDSPPVTQYADAIALAGAVDAVVMAIRLGRSRQDLVAEARGILARAGVPPVGLVLTRRRPLLPPGRISRRGGTREQAPVVAGQESSSRVAAMAPPTFAPTDPAGERRQRGATS